MRRNQVKKEAEPTITQAIRMIAKEKEISEDMLFAAVEDGLKGAYRKNLPRGNNGPASLSVTIVNEGGRDVPHIYARKLIVEEVEEGNENNQITLDEAKKINPTYQMGDIAEVDVTPSGFLRVAAQNAKQVIMQRIREAERGKIYDEYAEKENEILTAIVKRIEDATVYLDLGRTEGIMEEQDRIPGENYVEGDHIKVYVLSMKNPGYGSQRDPLVRVSRTHPNLVKRLFEMEVPEIAGGIVTIQSIAREAGSRTKMAVSSSQVMIDPVGACVGQRGGRVDRVVEELRGEKIDIIKWSKDPAEFVANALNPAHVVQVFTAENDKACRVVVPDNQLSLAIGKEGQNARLAARLTGWKIDIKSQTQQAEETAARMSAYEEAEDIYDEAPETADELPEEPADEAAEPMEPLPETLPDSGDDAFFVDDLPDFSDDDTL